MSLDLFQSSIDASDQAVAASAARDLPAGFGETFDVAWRAGTEFHNSVGSFIARQRALGDYEDYVFQKTGERLPHIGFAPAGIEGGGDVTLEEFNVKQAALAAKFPDLGLQPLTEADIDTMARRRMAKAHDDAKAMEQRETTWGGSAGTVAGMLAGSMTDPLVVATLPLGGIGEAGIALRAGEFALISGGTEAAVAAASYQAREAAVPGSSKEIPGEIAGATIFGGILGAGFGALGKLFKLGERPLPTALREDVNAMSSEAQLAATNPFPTAAGELAARDAVKDATASIVRGEPVRAGENFAPAYVSDYAAAAKAATPEDLAVAGERHIRPETYGEVPDVERFDPMPREADDAASYWERRLEAATPEERAAMGATDEGIRPRRSSDEGTSFTTAKGSTYEVQADGTTIRNKAFRPEHGAAEQGIQPASEATFYVDRAGLDALGEFQTQGLGKKALIEIEPGRWGMKYLEGKSAGKVERRTVVDVNASPEVGLTPVEIWKDGTRVHFGNEITEVRRPSAVDARDLSPDEMVKLAADPQVESAQLHNLEHIMQANPDADFTVATRLPDGSYRFDTRKLSDVMKDLDETELAAKEIEACAVGMMAAE